MTPPIWLRSLFLGLPLMAAAGPFLPVRPGPAGGLFLFRVAALFVLVYAIYVMLTRRPRIPTAARLALALGCLVQVWTAVAYLWSPDKEAAFDAAVSTIFPMSAFAAITFLACIYRSLLRSLCYGVVIAFVGAACVAAYDMFSGERFTEHMGVPLMFQPEIATSFFYNPNNFACFLVTVAALLLCDFIQPRPWWRRAVGAALLLLLVYFSLKTGSRTGLMGVFMLGGFVLLVLGFRTRFKGWLLGGSALTVLGVALFFVQRDRVMKVVYLVSDQFFNRSEVTQQSDDYRVLLSERGLQYFVDSGLMGAGPGNFVSILKTDPMLGNQPALNPHNMPVEIAAQLGLVGLVPFLLAVIFVLRECLIHNSARLRPALRLERDNHRLLASSLGVALTLYAVTPSSSFLENFWWISFAIVLVSSQSSADLRALEGPHEIDAFMHGPHSLMPKEKV